MEFLKAGGIPGGAERDQPPAEGVVKTAIELVVAELEALQQIEGVLGAQVGGHVVAVAGIDIELAHVTHLELGAVGASGGGGIDQLQGQVQAAVVVVADLGDHKGRGTVTDRPIAQKQAPLAAAYHGHHPAVVIQQGDHLDLGREQSSQIRSGAALCRADAVGIHCCRDRPVEVDQIGGCDPAAEVAIAQHALEDPAFGYHEDQAALVGRDLVQGRQQRVFREDHELGEIPLDLHRLHRSPVSAADAGL